MLQLLNIFLMHFMRAFDYLNYFKIFERAPSAPLSIYWGYRSEMNQSIFSLCFVLVN